MTEETKEIEPTTDEEMAQESGTVQHAQRVRIAKEDKENKKNFATKKEKYTTHGNKIIKLETLKNGNVKKTYAGTKKQNPALYKKASKG